MPQRILTTGFSTKILLTVITVLSFFGPDSFGRSALKLYSVGSSPVWNSPACWSLSVNGSAAGMIPQSNDTVIVNCMMVQNIDFSFSGNGSLIVLNTGLLRGDNFDLSFSDAAVLKCTGQLKSNNLTINNNAAFILEGNGEIIVKNTFINNSTYQHSLSGKLTVIGNFVVGPLVNITGNGEIVASHYSVSGSLMGLSSSAVIPDGSVTTRCNWTGIVNNEWTEPMNWSGGYVPDENANVAVLASAHNPVVSDRATCANLFVNSTSVFTVLPAAVMDVKGNLAVLGNGKFLLKNTVAAKSSLILNGDVTGKIQSEYPVVARLKNLVASPVELALSGTFLNMYLRPYDETLSQWGSYIVPTSDPLTTMEGYEIYSLFNDTRIFEGTPEHNTKSFAISNSGNGLNLTGNPFPCYIDWDNTDAWQRNSIASAIYYPDPSGSGNYSVYMPGGDDAVSLNNGSRYIAPMQGFFVKAGREGSLTVTENSRVSSFNDSRLIVKNNSIKLKLKNSSGSSDEALFRVITNSTFGFDDNFDAIKLQGNTDSPSLHFESGDNVKYAVNSIPIVGSSLSIPLAIECSKEGQYSISAFGASNFEYRCPVILEDKELNEFIDLRVDSVYTFVHNPGMNSKRFEIYFNSPDAINEQVGDILTEVKIYPGEVHVTGIENEFYTANLFSADGKMLSSAKGILSDGIKLTSGSQPYKVCFLQLVNGKHSITKKILTQ